MTFPADAATFPFTVGADRPSLHLEGDAELLCVHGLDGRVRFLSTGWSTLLGTSAARRLIGRDLLEVVHPHDRPLALAARRAVLEQERCVVVEVRLRTPDGDLSVEALARPPLAGQRAYVSVLRRMT